MHNNNKEHKLLYTTNNNEKRRSDLIMFQVRTIENPMYKNHRPIFSAFGQAYMVEHKVADNSNSGRTIPQDDVNNRTRKINLTKKGYDEIDELFGLFEE